MWIRCYDHARLRTDLQPTVTIGTAAFSQHIVPKLEKYIIE